MTQLRPQFKCISHSWLVLESQHTHTEPVKIPWFKKLCDSPSNKSILVSLKSITNIGHLSLKTLISLLVVA